MCDYKQCSRCKETKAVSEFHNNKRRKNQKETWSYYRSHCKACSHVLTMQNKEKYPHRWITNRYKITKEAAYEWYLKTMEHCEICGIPWVEGEPKLCIDHDHVTGGIRGILCKHCNHVLGHAYDKIEVLEKSIEYLRERG